MDVLLTSPRLTLEATPSLPLPVDPVWPVGLGCTRQLGTGLDLTVDAMWNPL
jgi:hypothetical protein